MIRRHWNWSAKNYAVFAFYVCLLPPESFGQRADVARTRAIQFETANVETRYRYYASDMLANESGRTWPKQRVMLIHGRRRRKTYTGFFGANCTPGNAQ